MRLAMVLMFCQSLSSSACITQRKSGKSIPLAIATSPTASSMVLLSSSSAAAQFARLPLDGRRPLSSSLNSLKVRRFGALVPNLSKTSRNSPTSFGVRLDLASASFSFLKASHPSKSRNSPRTRNRSVRPTRPQRPPPISRSTSSVRARAPARCQGKWSRRMSTRSSPVTMPVLCGSHFLKAARRQSTSSSVKPKLRRTLCWASSRCCATCRARSHKPRGSTLNEPRSARPPSPALAKGDDFVAGATAAVGG
mmetsp:Transcript_80767/g.223414  ORF Transcript_80767/g.223414 Transcript_80767/m.223414 type:complete len:252 (-) Transcript_80767:927-1682(-)